MKFSLSISNFLEEISSLSQSIVFLYFFASIAEEGFVTSPCYSLKLCIQMGMRPQVRSLGWEDPLEKEMAPHSSTLAWKIPWTEEPDRLQSTGSQRVGHDWATSFSLFTFTFLFSFAFSFCSFPALFKASSDNHFCLFVFFPLGMVLITASCTTSRTSIHSSSGTLPYLILWLYLSLPLYNHKGFDLGHTWMV